jgi:hypothetical protein
LIRRPPLATSVAFVARVALVAFVACRPTPPDRATAAPDGNAALVAPAVDPRPALSFADIRCTYGGAKPAFFVGLETTTASRISDLHATKFEIATVAGGYVSGASAAIDLRARPTSHGQGSVTPLPAPIEAGELLHLEIFGALSLAPFGAGASYPTDARSFRVELVANEGRWTVSGSCAVGPAG